MIRKKTFSVNEQDVPMIDNPSLKSIGNRVNEIFLQRIYIVEISASSMLQSYQKINLFLHILLIEN